MYCIVFKNTEGEKERALSSALGKASYARYGKGPGIFEGSGRQGPISSRGEMTASEDNCKGKVCSEEVAVA